MTFTCDHCNYKYQTNSIPGRCGICGCPEFTISDTDHDRKDSAMRVSAIETETGATVVAAVPEDEGAIDQLLHEQATNAELAPWEEKMLREMAEPIAPAATAPKVDEPDSEMDEAIGVLVVDGLPPELTATTAAEDNQSTGEAAAVPLDGSTLPAEQPEISEQLRIRVTRQLETKVADAAVRRAYAKAEAKATGKRFDDATEELADYLGRPAEKLPLFDQAKQNSQGIDNATPVAVTFGKRSVKTTAGEVLDVIDEVQAEEFGPWQKVPLTELRIPAGIVKVLAEKSEIISVGQLADWTSAGNNLVDLPGIGKSKAERLEEGLEEFWRMRKA